MIEESSDEAAKGLRREAVLAAIADAEEIEVSEEELLRRCSRRARRASPRSS